MQSRSVVYKFERAIRRKIVSLIDNVFNSVAREVNKVQTRSQDLMQTMSLQNQINELERRKTMRLAEIGKVVFDEKHNHAPAREDEVKRLCDEVASLEAEMAVLQAEIDKVKAKNDPDATPSQKAEASAAQLRSHR